MDAPTANELHVGEPSSDNTEMCERQELLAARTPGLCRSEKKRKRREEYTEWKKMKRKEKKSERKERFKSLGENDEKAKADTLSKKDQKSMCEARCREALEHGQRVCVDLSMGHLMTDKETSKVAQQLCRMYGSNRHVEKPFHLYFTGLDKDGKLYQECIRKNNGFDKYLVDMTENLHTEVFMSGEIVYLSPDAKTALTTLDDQKVYVIGGLVDECIQKNITKSKSETSGIATARLPVQEYMERGPGTGTFNFVLALNQVFDILLTYSHTGDWRKALLAGVPPRKGFVMKAGNESTCS